MPKIYDNFGTIADRFDHILVDAYGVFWGGKDFLAGSLETLSEQVTQGKNVVVVSNSTQLSAQAMQSYAKRGLIKGVHYTDFVTSGDVAHQAFVEQKLDIKGNKIYIFGNSTNLFADTPYCITAYPDEADAFYISVPQLSETQAMEQNIYEDRLFRSPKGMYDSITIEPFVPELKKLYRLGLTAINGNPDYRASESDAFGVVRYVIRQGEIAETYRRMGGKVIEFGKPHRNIFDYVLKKLSLSASSRIAMIGDTFRTDIKGAENCGITGVWCIETGITAEDIRQGRSIEQICDHDFGSTLLIKRLGALL